LDRTVCPVAAALAAILVLAHEPDRLDPATLPIRPRMVRFAPPLVPPALLLRRAIKRMPVTLVLMTGCLGPRLP
jgi:hypothetical protein